MARTPDMKSLVDRFTAELEQILKQQLNEQVAARMDELRGEILGAGGRAPSATRRTLRAGRPGPRAGYAAAEKPCPVCGKMNKARRFSFLCEDHRTPENLAKFKGTSRQPGAGEETAAPAKGGRGARKKAGRPAKAAAGRRGPGRPRKGEKAGRGKGEKATEGAAQS